jgi:hypothetical protein
MDLIGNNDDARDQKDDTQRQPRPSQKGDEGCCEPGTFLFFF